MKKTTIIAFVLGIFLVSCGGKAVETGEAQEVPENNSVEAVEYSNVDAGSYITWKATHLGGVGARFGKVSILSASIKVSNENINSATIAMDMNSLTVENFEEGDEQKDKLTADLKSKNFFNVEENPTSTFELTSIEESTGEFNSVVTGNLTILNTSKSISFNANVNITEDAVSINSEEFILDRTDWGLTYLLEGTEGVPVDYLIANDLTFSINATVNK